MKDVRRSGLEGKFFQSGLVESDIPLCQARARNNKKRQHVQRARVSVVRVSSHPDVHVVQSACLHPVFWIVLGGHGGHQALLQQEQGREAQLQTPL